MIEGLDEYLPREFEFQLCAIIMILTGGPQMFIHLLWCDNDCIKMLDEYMVYVVFWSLLTVLCDYVYKWRTHRHNVRENVRVLQWWSDMQTRQP